MTDQQFYTAIAIPLFGILVNVGLYVHLSQRIDHLGTYVNGRIDQLGTNLNARIDLMIGAMNEFDKRVTVIERHLHIDP